MRDDDANADPAGAPWRRPAGQAPGDAVTAPGSGAGLAGAVSVFADAVSDGAVESGTQSNVADASAAGGLPSDGATARSAARVQAALSDLDGLDDRPLAEHADYYQRLHGHLTDVLAEIDSA